MTEPFVNQTLVLAGTQKIIVDPASGSSSIVNAGPPGPRGLPGIGGGGSGGGTVFIDGFGFPSNGTSVVDYSAATHISIDGTNHYPITTGAVVLFYDTAPDSMGGVSGFYICDGPGTNSLYALPSDGLMVVVSSNSGQVANFGQGPFPLTGASIALDLQAGKFIPTSPIAFTFAVADMMVIAHKAESTPHTAYDDIQSLTLLFENGLA